MSIPKVKQRILEAVEKMRKNLTPNKEAELLIEELMDGEDMEHSFTRDSFEKIIQQWFLEPFVRFLTECSFEVA